MVVQVTPQLGKTLPVSALHGAESEQRWAGVDLLMGGQSASWRMEMRLPRLGVDAELLEHPVVQTEGDCACYLHAMTYHLTPMAKHRHAESSFDGPHLGTSRIRLSSRVMLG